MKQTEHPDIVSAADHLAAQRGITQPYDYKFSPFNNGVRIILYAADHDDPEPAELRFQYRDATVDLSVRGPIHDAQSAQHHFQTLFDAADCVCSAAVEVTRTPEGLQAGVEAEHVHPYAPSRAYWHGHAVPITYRALQSTR